MDTCPGCGLQINGDAAGCQRLADALWARDFSQPVQYFKWHRLNVDAYALQHPDSYCASAKSLLAHLCGVCCALEHGGNEEVLRALQRSLNGNPEVERPLVPARRGILTIADVDGIEDVEQYAYEVRRWAADVWLAYAPLQDFARQWLARAAAL